MSFLSFTNSDTDINGYGNTQKGKYENYTNMEINVNAKLDIKKIQNQINMISMMHVNVIF